MTYYNFSYTSEEGESCNEPLPASTTSYNLLAEAGVLYTVTVSAITTDIESRNNTQLDFGKCSYLHILSDVLLKNIYFRVTNLHTEHYFNCVQLD